MRCMAERDSSWWIHPEDVPNDMARLVDVIGARDWAIFSNARQDPDAPPPIALAISESADGRLVCTGLIIGLNEAYSTPAGAGTFGEPMEVTSRDLRAIPVAELIGRAVHNAPAHHQAAKRLALGRAPQLEAVRRAPGPKGHPDEHFQWIADEYRRALAARPKAPVAWLTEELGVDRSTITRWLQRARDKGYLGAAQPGKAGERKDETS